MKRSITHAMGTGSAALAATSLLSRRIGFLGEEGRVGRSGLLALGGLGLTVLATAGWRSRSGPTAGSGHAPVAEVPSNAPAAASCVLTPEQTQGPYYIAREKVRSNIAEHRAGTPLALRLTVVDAATCAPLKGATVDIWHCDAGGVYSGFESASTGGPGGGPGGAGPTDKDTFLRGIQRTDARGSCAFRTIYPGWYRGRTVHIHVIVHLGGTVVHTGQLYFPDSLTDTVYQAAPYKARPARDTRNSTDGIYQSGGPQSTLTLSRSGSAGYTGAIVLGVRP